MNIDLDGLTFGYDRHSTAIDDISAGIGPGIHLLLGENGAGKTTLLHLIDGLLYPRSGECLIDRTPTKFRLPSILSKVAFLADNMGFPAATINATARCHSRFYPNFDPELLAANLQRFGLTGDEKLKKLSLGNRHKSQLAYFIALRPSILLLAELANGLDIESRQELQRMLAESVDEEQTVIVSTHTFSDLQNLYDSVIILSHGRLRLAASIERILNRVAFVSSTVPHPDTMIYFEPRLGRTHGIVRVEDADTATDIDYALLYNAVKSAHGDRLIQIIKDND